MEALIEDENAMDKGVANTIKDHKQKHDDDDDDDDYPPGGPNQGKKTKRRSTKESESSKKPSFTKETSKVLESYNPERTYTMSITKIKAARYEIEGVKDMVHTLWSPTKFGYNKDALKGIKYWGEWHKIWHTSQLKKFSKHNVHAASCCYHKLFHLTDNDIVDFIVALRMFTRSLIIKRRVEDLQLGVEKRVMRADELYKFSDGTLKKVQDELHHRLLNFDLGYNKEMRRKWTAIDKKRSKLMVELIDKQMREKGSFGIFSTTG
ncbi:hypothetical protein Tco_0944908 [Tanacetum coccineum]